jgi:CHAT domain
MTVTARNVPAYNELQLRLAPGPEGRYELCAVAAGGATAYGTFAFPFSPEALENFRYTVDPATARAVRGAGSPRRDRAKQFGTQLFDALTADAAVRDVYSTARHDAERAGRGLRITLYLTRTPELAEVPWEFLYQRPEFLAQSVWTPVVRYLDLPEPPRPLRVDAPLRVLGMISRPVDGDLAQLDTAQERANLERALGDLTGGGLVEVRWLEHATLRDLQREVAHGDDFHIFHYIGHGEYDERADEGFLVLERPDGRALQVSGEELGTMLGDRKSLRLAVLNACEAAKTASQDPLAGVAANLIEQGVPAAVGMQFAITDRGAIDFAEEFYATLAEGYPVDAAVTEARRAMASNDEIEWGTPVLFMRVADGRLFDVTGAGSGGEDEELAPGTTELAVPAPPAEGAREIRATDEPASELPDEPPEPREPPEPPEPPGPASPEVPSEPRPGGGRPHWLLPVAALLAAIAVAVGLVVGLSGGGDKTPTLGQGVQQLSAILDFSSVGKRLSRDHRDFVTAAANRGEVLDRINAFDPPPQLRASVETLRRLTRDALEFNRLKARGLDARAKFFDDRANRLRRTFMKQFNPFAKKFLGRTYLYHDF